MPQPRRQQVHVDGPLTNLSIAYQQAQGNFIADTVFPTVRVNKQSDVYFVYDIDDFYRTDAQRRPPGTESAGSGWNITTDSYFCEKWAIHKDIDDDIRDNADSPINLDRDATEFITLDMMIRNEIEWTTAFFATSLWTGSLTAGDITPGNLWDTVAGTPIDDIQEQADSIAEKTGYKPNTLVLGPEVFKELKNHPDILDRIKYTQTGIVSKDLMASLFEVDRVLVPYATRNTAAEEATATFDFLYGKNAFLCYSAPSAGIYQPSAGYTFKWRGKGGRGAGHNIKKFRMEKLASDRVELNQNWDQKLVAANLGVFFSAVVS